MSPQAKRLADAVRKLGLPRTVTGRASWGVRTHTYRRGGVRYYGDAYLVLYTREANEVVCEHAAQLRAAGLRVDIWERDGKRFASVGG